MPVHTQDPPAIAGPSYARRAGPPVTQTRDNTMSNATHESPNPGRKRRRRNRGGQNRNHDQNPQDRQGGRGEGQSRREGGRREGGRREGGPRHHDRGQRDRRAMPKPAPKLTLWQKIKKIFGFYKEPVRPARTPQSERPRQERGERQERSGQQPKSNIRIARPQERKETERGPVESPRLYLGNLSYETTESDLEELFKGIGGVRNVEIVYNRNTHRSKGYGFVEMLHVDDAKRAVEVLHDQPFMGRKINVSGAKSKGFDEREEKDEDRPVRAQRPPRPAKAETAEATAAAAAAVATVAAASAAAPAEEIPAVTGIETAPAGVDPTPVAVEEVAAPVEAAAVEVEAPKEAEAPVEATTTEETTPES